MNTTSVKKSQIDQRILDTVGYVFIAVICLACLIPFLLIISGSLTSESSITSDGFRLWPKEFSWDAYTFALKHPEQFVSSYLLTILLTVTGTVVGLFISAMAAYVLSVRILSGAADFRSSSTLRPCLTVDLYLGIS